MARRKKGGMDTLAALPWPVGVLAGIVGYLVIRHGIGWWFATAGGSIGQGLAKPFAEGTLAPLAWIVLGICWIAALASYLGSRRRRKLLDAHTGLDSFHRADWREFELLVGEAYRRQGYAVEETGLGGADGGIDLILRKGGRTTLVQVKQWRNQQVDVRVVREMYGLMAHHSADAVRVAALGGFTADARAFARDKPIELIDGTALMALVSSVQADASTGIGPVPSGITAAPHDQATPLCPRCGMTMLLRNNRRTRAEFWGCPTYPKCQGTRAA